MDDEEKFSAIVQHALIALKEGGLRWNYNKLFGMLMCGGEGDSNRVTLIDTTQYQRYRLFVALLLPFDAKPEQSELAQINIVLDLYTESPQDAPGILISRRVDGPWKGCAGGTLGLPIGHPLADLAHDEKHLGLSRTRLSVDLDDERSFRIIMKIAHLFEHGII